MKMNKIFMTTALCLGLHTGLATAQSTQVTGLPIGVNDSAVKVKELLQTSLTPEPASYVNSPTKTELHIKTKGIWVFFDKDDRAISIRLDPPFSGNVGGVKIGDTRDKLINALGKPAKIVKSETKPTNKSEPYEYYFDDITTMKFLFDRDDEIETIFLIR
jgi:hypothetical protein